MEFIPINVGGRWLGSLNFESRYSFYYYLHQILNMSLNLKSRISFHYYVHQILNMSSVTIVILSH